MITLLRYNNRKLYNKTSCQYSTAIDLVAALKDGENVKVLSYATRDDITVKVLSSHGASLMNSDNIEGGSLLIRYAQAYRAL